MTVTWNPSDQATNLTLSSGNLLATNNNSAGASWGAVRATTSHNSGKQYVEFVVSNINNAINMGLATGDGSLATGNHLGTLGATASFGQDNRVGVFTSEGGFSFTGGYSPPVFVANDVFGVAIDITNGNLWVSKNNSYTVFGIAGSNPSTLTNPALTVTAGLTLFPAGACNTNTDAVIIHADSSNQTYTPPTNFVAWGGAAATTVFRRTLSALGTRTGTRQAII